jgi:hypothetical protein
MIQVCQAHPIALHFPKIRQPRQCTSKRIDIDGDKDSVNARLLPVYIRESHQSHVSERQSISLVPKPCVDRVHSLDRNVLHLCVDLSGWHYIAVFFTVYTRVIHCECVFPCLLRFIDIGHRALLIYSNHMHLYQLHVEVLYAFNCVVRSA